LALDWEDVTVQLRKKNPLVDSKQGRRNVQRRRRKSAPNSQMNKKTDI